MAGSSGGARRQNSYLELVLQEEQSRSNGEGVRQPARPRAPPRLVQPRMVFGGGSVAPVRKPAPIKITLPNGHRVAPTLPRGVAANPLDGHSQISRAQQAAAKAATGAAITRYLNPSAPAYRAPPTLAGDGGPTVVPPKPTAPRAIPDVRSDFRERSTSPTRLPFENPPLPYTLMDTALATCFVLCAA